LARTLGKPSRRAMYRAMTAADLLEWEVDFAISPWDEERADLRNGILCSLLDACHRTKGTSPQPVDFMPYSKKPKRRQSVAAMKANLAAFMHCKPEDLGKK
jgi:hypothetical protein